MSLNDLFLLAQIWVWVVVIGVLALAALFVQTRIKLIDDPNNKTLQLRLWVSLIGYLVLLAYAVWIDPWSFLF